MNGTSLLKGSPAMSTLDRNVPGPQANRISSRTGGDRRTQMRLIPRVRVKAVDMPAELPETFTKDVRLRCVNCGQGYGPGKISLTAQAWARINPANWLCGRCWAADNTCANCHCLIRGDSRTNRQGLKVHKNRCPNH